MPMVARRRMLIQSRLVKARKKYLSRWNWMKQRRIAPIPNRSAKRANGCTSAMAILIAMNENPQMMIAARAGQDKIVP